MIKVTAIFLLLSAGAYSGGVVLSAVLGLLCFLCLVGALLVYEDRFDFVDRVAVAGLAGSMILTTPALFLPTPFDGWSFNLSRAFLGLFLLRRLGIPVFWSLVTHHRVRLNAALDDPKAARKRKFRDVG